MSPDAGGPTSGLRFAAVAATGTTLAGVAATALAGVATALAGVAAMALAGVATALAGVATGALGVATTLAAAVLAGVAVGATGSTTMDISGTLILAFSWSMVSWGRLPSAVNLLTAALIKDEKVTFVGRVADPDPYNFPGSGYVSKFKLDPDPTKTVENLIFLNLIKMIMYRK